MHGAAGFAALSFLSGAFSEPRHLTTDCGAGAAGLGTTDHQIVFAHLFATAGTALTHFSACPARMYVQFRIAQHEIGAGLADLRAISKQADVVSLRKAPALAKAMRQGLKADAMTAAALLNTFLHARIVTVHESFLAQCS